MRDLSLLLSRFNVKMPVAADIKPLALQKALIAMEGRPEERMVSTVALRSLKQAVYQTDNIGHFGLAAEYYTHFTSPIRRYPDLIVHRLLHKWLADPYMKEKQRTNILTSSTILPNIHQYASALLPKLNVQPSI